MLITANTAPELHALAFRYRYMAINIGAALGPLAGILLSLEGSPFSFHATCGLLMFYACMFLLMNIDRKRAPAHAGFSGNVKQVLGHMMRDKAFLLLIGANLCVTMTYGQIFSTLPQILHAQIKDSRQLYSILLTVNPLTVIAVSLFLNQFLSKKNVKKLFSFGALLLTVSFIGFHFSKVNYANYIFFMVLFTLAEISLIPTTSKFLFDLAPEKYRGAYLGSESSSYLGFFIGNLIGGWLLQNGQSVFLFCVLCGFISFFLYRLSCRKQAVTAINILT